MPKRSPSTPSGHALESHLIGRWFTGARREGFLAFLPPEAWHTLSAVLSFTARDGRRMFTVDQLAAALALPRAVAGERLTGLAEIDWQGQPLLTLEQDPAGVVVGASLAPLELFARVGPDDTTADTSHPTDADAPPPDSDADEIDLTAVLSAIGLNPAQTEWLTRRFPAERIRQQLAWLPARHANNPAAMLIRAVEQDWGPPREAA